jgi:peroxiredoxin (alkyl hydroperoxide reductase subunit C)
VAIAAGERVPDFSLQRLEGSVTQADLDGTTLLVFFPFAFSDVCTNQLSILHELRDDLAERGVTVYGVSCDAPEANAAFRTQLGVDFPLLSDWEPKGAVAKAFGVLHPAGMPERALVLVGPDGVVQWSHQAENPGVLPGANLVFDALDASATR